MHILAKKHGSSQYARSHHLIPPRQCEHLNPTRTDVHYRIFRSKLICIRIRVNVSEANSNHVSSFIRVRIIFWLLCCISLTPCHFFRKCKNSIESQACKRTVIPVQDGCTLPYSCGCYVPTSS